MQSGLVVPPTTQPSIGDVLSAHNIPWKYYGGGFNADGTASPFNGSYCNICNPFEYRSDLSRHGRRSHARRDRSVHRSGQRHAAGGRLREAGRHDGRPSRFLEVDAVRSVCRKHHRAGAKQSASSGRETAIFVTVDEGGGYYDSGFIQPVDFFGTGPRIPMIAVSPFSTGGHVSHAYNEHSSFVKFVERNWKLARHAQRPQPRQPAESRCRAASNAYVPQQHAGDR